MATLKPNSPRVNFTRVEVRALKPIWDRIRDCIAGQTKIKEKADAYLPRPNAADTSPENRARYLAYLQRAVFYGVTGRTLRGLVGEVFKRDPVVTLPPQLDGMVKDIDGASVSANQQSKKALGLVLAYGRAGLLVDYPVVQKAATVKQLADGEIKPTFTLFDPWDIINWRVKTVNNKTLLSLVVLSEKEVVDDDGFEQEWDPYFRVLRLVDGVYHSQIWWFDTQANEFKQESDNIPLDSTGNPWTEIPFTFIGSENNNSEPDKAPLEDLADLNIAHYCNSADYEECAYMLGQATPVFSGLDEGWIARVFENKPLKLGSRGSIPLPVGATAELLQAEANTMIKEAMDGKERQMVALGAKLVEQKEVQRTAFETGVDKAAETSVLATSATNVSEAYTTAFHWAAKFVGVQVSEENEAQEEQVSYRLNTKFDLDNLNAADAAAIISAWQANAITKSEMRDKLQAGGWAHLDFEKYLEEIEGDGIDLGVPVGSAASQAQANLDAQKEAAAQAAKDNKDAAASKQSAKA